MDFFARDNGVSIEGGLDRRRRVWPAGFLHGGAFVRLPSPETLHHVGRSSWSATIPEADTCIAANPSRLELARLTPNPVDPFGREGRNFFIFVIPDIPTLATLGREFRDDDREGSGPLDRRDQPDFLLHLHHHGDDATWQAGRSREARLWAKTRRRKSDGDDRAKMSAFAISAVEHGAEQKVGIAIHLSMAPSVDAAGAPTGMPAG